MNGSNDEKNIYIISFEANWKHAWHWFISLREQNHAFLGSALHFIQIPWFTYVFVNIRRVTKWVQFAGCSLDL